MTEQVKKKRKRIRYTDKDGKRREMSVPKSYREEEIATYTILVRSLVQQLKEGKSLRTQELRILQKVPRWFQRKLEERGLVKANNVSSRYRGSNRLQKTPLFPCVVNETTMFVACESR